MEVVASLLKIAQLLRSTACLHTNQSQSYLNHLVQAGYPQVTEMNLQATVFILLIFTHIHNCLYSYAPHNDGLHIRRWSHNNII